MKQNQKIGVLVMMLSILTAFFIIIISYTHYPGNGSIFNFENIFGYNKISLFSLQSVYECRQISNDSSFCYLVNITGDIENSYLISFSTKYLNFLLVITFFYGLLVYLKILPVIFLATFNRILAKSDDVSE